MPPHAFPPLLSCRAALRLPGPAALLPFCGGPGPASPWGCGDSPTDPLTLLGLVVKLVSDMLYTVVDPRVQFGSVGK